MVSEEEIKRLPAGVFTVSVDVVISCSPQIYDGTGILMSSVVLINLSLIATVHLYALPASRVNGYIWLI